MKFIPENNPSGRARAMESLAQERISAFKDNPRRLSHLNPLILADMCELYIQGRLSSVEADIFGQACIESVTVGNMLSKMFDAARWEQTSAGQKWVRKIEYRLVA